MPSSLLDDTLTDELETTSLEEEEEAAPDTEGETEAEQPEPAPNPYEGKTQEEIDALIARAVTDAEAKARQSEIDRGLARQKQADDTRKREQFQKDQQAAQNLANGRLEQDFLKSVETHAKAAVAAFENGQDVPEVDSRAWKDAVWTYWTGLRNADATEWADVANSWLKDSHPGYNPPAELVTAAGDALRDYDQGRYMKTLLAIAEAAGEQKGVAKGQSKRAEDEQIQKLESKNGRQPGPTGAAGGTPRASIPDLNEPGISEDERRRRWGSNPLTSDLPFPVR